MKCHADPHDCRRRQRGGKAEGVEEREDTQKPVPRAEVEQLAQLLGVRQDIVVGEHDPFRFASAATGKNHGGEVVQGARPFASDSSLEYACWREPRQREREQFFSKARLGGDFFQQESAAGDFHFDAVEKGF